jgi:hypothetical protein
LDEGIIIPIELQDDFINKQFNELSDKADVTGKKISNGLTKAASGIGKLKSSTIDLVSSLRTSFDPAVYNAFVGGSRNIVVMKEAMQTLRENMRLATNPAQIRLYSAAINDLKVNIKQLEGVSSRLTGGILGRGGALGQVRQLANILPGIGMAGLIGAAFSGVQLLMKELFGLGDIAEKISPKIKELAGHIVDEASKLTLLTGIIQNTNSSYNNKQKALQAINQEYSTYLKNLGIEKVTVDNLKDSYDKIIDSMLRQAVVKGLQDEISKAVEKTAQELVQLEVKEEKRRIASDAAMKAMQQQSSVQKTLADSVRIFNKPLSDGYLAQVQVNAATQAAIEKFDSYDERVKRLKENLIQTLAPLLNVTKSFSDLGIELDNVKKKTDKPFELFGELRFKPVALIPLDDADMKAAQKAFEERAKRLPPLMTKLPFKIEISDFEKSQEFRNKLQAIREMILSSTQSIFETIGEQFGNVLAGGNIKNAFQSFFSVIGDALQQVGKKYIAISYLMVALKKSLDKLFVNPAAALPIGLALVALGSSLKSFIQNSKIKGFAQGGLVSAPMLGLVGEGIGTSRSNPEVIAPLNQLKNIFATMLNIRGTGINGNRQVQTQTLSINIPDEINLRAAGRDLVGVITLENASQYRGG